jgi:hypothetical protein
MDSRDNKEIVVFNFLSPIQIKQSELAVVALAIVLAKIQSTLDLLADMLDKNTQQQAQLRGQVIQLQNQVNDIKRGLRER